MKQRFFLLALALFFPIQGQSQSESANANENHSQDKVIPGPPRAAAPSTEISTVNQDTVAKQSPGTANKPEDYLSRLFSPENIPSVILCIVGIGGIIVAIRTLNALSRQALSMRYQTTHLRNSVIHTRKAANAAKRSADALINSERAWIIVSKTDWPSKHGWYAPDLPQYRPGMAFLFEVSGKTAARITDSHFILEPVPARAGTSPLEPELPLVPNYTVRPRSTEIPEDGRLLTPGQKFQIMVGLSRDLTVDEWEELRDQRKLMCAYGRIKYDSLGQHAETAVCYVFRFNYGGVITSTDGTVLNPAGFEIGGPTAYNRST